MEMATSRTSEVSTSERAITMTQAVLCGLAAAISTLRAFRTDEASGVALVSIAALLALGGAVVAFRSRRWAATPVAVALVMEFTVLMDVAAPPRILNAIPLLLAFGLAVVPGRWGQPPATNGKMRGVVTVVSLGLMVPLGVAFIVGPNLIAPYPDIYLSYLLFAVLVAVTIVFARRQSWWVASMPVASAGVFLLMVQLGGAYRDWGG